MRRPRAVREVAAVARLRGWTFAGERPGGAGKLPLILLEGGLPGLQLSYIEHDGPALCGIASTALWPPSPSAGSPPPSRARSSPGYSPSSWTTSTTEPTACSPRGRAGLDAPGAAEPALLARFSAATEDPNPASASSPPGQRSFSPAAARQAGPP
ncbi:hypothetical protein HCN51_55590 [Nonomuraea sp. FMUSA5-5]|uniref:Uncharacterized protein n=1 Tax=Nonomuraea composti TaxID=2720023 RepID=A0ABX1BPM6_9ACTN|nr:hypothetical protein [Nonomuraea sp. FMUSA5-5]NJP98549.1 hypothetical protein [Nonomuraea sp. FMUSA5-5]